MQSWVYLLVGSLVEVSCMGSVIRPHNVVTLVICDRDNMACLLTVAVHIRD